MESEDHGTQIWHVLDEERANRERIRLIQSWGWSQKRQGEGNIDIRAVS